jgi:hypothetical protein
MGAVFLMLLSVYATAADPAKLERIEALFAAVNSEDEPGVAALVLKDGRVIFQRGCGVADLKTRAKIDAHTDFRLASVSKQFTAMAAMMLVHDGETVGFRTTVQRFPDDRLTIIVLCNRSDMDPTALALKVADLVGFGP